MSKDVRVLSDLDLDSGSTLHDQPLLVTIRAALQVCKASLFKLVPYIQYFADGAGQHY